MRKLRLIIVLLSSVLLTKAQTGNELAFQKWALTPPMGWNSWDCFGPSVTESEVKANADYMAANLKQYGWKYIVVDIRWYVDNQTTGTYNSYASSTFIYDTYGRYMPSPTRFPSAVNGNGFKPLADYVHNQGLKFGIHIMRGVPKIAVTNSLSIKGSSKIAADIYTTNDQCTWLQDNYTVLAEKEGAQEYYNSIFDLYASWGVDFVKVDDLSRPYHQDEIEMIRKAIDQTGRPIVLSMSPGETPVEKYEHVKTHANMWRTVDDFWDNWSQLNYQFTVCNKWSPYIAPGTWPDADMLPLGHIAIRGERGVDRQTNFTKDEQYTLMTLWSIFKSPLMFGGNLPDNEAFTDSLLTNDEVLYMHKTSVNNRQWYNQEDRIAWTADDPKNGDKFVALFNNGGDGFVKTKSLLYRSGTISRLTDGYGTNIDIQLPEDSKQLFLIVNDGGDGYSCDHADWINPVLYLENGDSILVTDLSWEYATAGWNSVQINKSVSGGTLNVKGTSYTNGIGTHAKSIIFYPIPDNCVRFKAFAGLDIGGTSQLGGATVEFMVATEDPTPRNVDPNKSIANSGRISRTSQRQGIKISADIAGEAKLYLVVTDAGDNYNYDHADWINPAIYKSNGDSLLLTSLNWVSATSGWGSVNKNKSLNGNTLTVNGQTYANGFGLNSYSIIEFDLPNGYTNLKSFCGFDDEVLNASDGVSVEFLVFTKDPANTNTIPIPVDLTKLGFTGSCTVRNLWKKTEVGNYSGSDFAPSIISHGAGLYRISAVNRSNDISVVLTTSATQANMNDTVILAAEVNKTGSITDTVSGWIMLTQNDTLVATIQIDSLGKAQFETSSLSAGVHTFTANYSGNTVYNPQTSNQVTVEIKKNELSMGNINEQPKVWIATLGSENYLQGTVPGDEVMIVNIYGQATSVFKATSDSQLIAGEGMVLIKVKSANGYFILKAVL